MAPEKMAGLTITDERLLKSIHVLVTIVIIVRHQTSLFLDIVFSHIDVIQDIALWKR